MSYKRPIRKMICYPLQLSNRIVPIHVGLSFFLTGLILIAASTASYGLPPSEVGIVTADILNVRPDPGLKNPPIITLKKGDLVEVLEHVGGWLKIRSEDQIGYIRNRKRYIRIETKKDKLREAIGSEKKIDQLEEEAAQISQKIKKQKNELKAVTRKEKKILSRLNDIGLALNSSRKRVSSYRTELVALDKEIAEKTAASTVLRRKIDENERYASKRVVAYYKMSWLGKMHVLASAESFYDLFQRKAFLEKILTHDESVWKTLSENRGDLQKTLVTLHKQRVKKEDLEGKLEKQIKIMSTERVKRTQVLEEIRDKKSTAVAAIDSLKKAESDLDHMIKSFRKAKSRIDAIKKLEHKRFVELKGLLKKPVAGKIISRFGSHKNSKYNIVNFRSGIDIRADMGEPVHAVSGGSVLYASWLRGYGNMIIIDHGDSYYTVYAHAEELFKSKGDTVEPLEVIATVGDTGSLTGPGLYFEVRYHGKPLDPLKWIKRG